MKSLFAYMDLLMLVVFMLFGVTLIANVATQCRKSSMEYLDDKTLYTIGESMEWVEVTDVDGTTRWVPYDASALRVDIGGAICLALIQDDYCPAEARKIEYLYEADSPTYATTASPNSTLQIVTGWRTLKIAEFEGVLAEAGTNAIVDLYNGKDLYLVWNIDRDNWMITSKFINIY